jgi:ferredoxin
MIIEIDRERCESHGRCEYVAGAVFRLDDDGKPHVAADVPEGLREEVELAAAVCPALAIRVER